MRAQMVSWTAVVAAVAPFSVLATLSAVTGCTAILGYDGVAFEEESGDGDSTKANAVDPACVPSDGSKPVGEECGVFVSAAKGSDSNLGTKKSPFKTLAKAVSTGRAVYACASAAFEESVAIDGDAAIFGALDCEHDWEYVAGEKTIWTAPADQVPLRANEQSNVQVRDMLIAAASAKMPGGSSIAVIAAAQATLDVRRCDISAGDARDGLAPTETTAKGEKGLPGQKGKAGCAGIETATAPGLGGQLACQSLDVTGGPGGPGLALTSGADGSDGSPVPVEPSTGVGGKKQDSTPCSPGLAGMVGEDGTPGAGAKALGTLTHEGYSGSEGEPGLGGKPGQGGGGGGGARMCTNTKAGPSGGGGGSGGCGGLGGQGGRAGGSSIGVVSLNAKVTLADVKITVRRGGDGGKGGRGGGGHGGHSIGVAHRGAAPAINGASINVDEPGEGGDGDGGAGKGSAGVATMLREFE